MAQQLIIEGVTEEGNTFRPSDWSERISSALASFGADHHLRYSAYAFPCTIAGERCLVIDPELATADPDAYRFVLKFASDNRLRIQPDRRRQPRHVRVEIARSTK